MKYHKTLLRQLRRHNIEISSLPSELLVSISKTYTDFEFREDKLHEIIEVSNFELTNKNNQVNEILESLPSFVSWVDNDLNYLGANKNLENLLGLDKSKFIGKHIGFGNSKVKNFFVEALEIFSKSDKESEVFQYVDFFNGEEKFLDVYLQKIGTGGKIIINSIDQTEKIKLTQKIAREFELKTHQERLLQLGEMAAGVAHEVNNPMTVILGQSQSLLRKIKEFKLIDNFDSKIISEFAVDIEKRVEKISSMSNRVSSIVKSLKALSRNSENDNFTDESLSNLLAPAIELAMAKLKIENIEFDVVNLENPILSCRPSEITQVFCNLINNSIDAIKKLPEKWIKVTVINSEKFLEVRVMDSGKGLPIEIENKIFFPFFTTKAVNQGTGLGLSLSKKIIENHDAKIFVDKTMNNTCFVIQFKNGIK